jgi:hypothetical protein
MAGNARTGGSSPTSRYRELLSVADVENAIVDEIELYPEIDYQSFDWDPINRAFERLRKIADERAQAANTR